MSIYGGKGKIWSLRGLKFYNIGKRKQNYGYKYFLFINKMLRRLDLKGHFPKMFPSFSAANSVTEAKPSSSSTGVFNLNMSKNMLNGYSVNTGHNIQ